MGEFTLEADNRLKIKEISKRYMYLELAKELRKLRGVFMV